MTSHISFLVILLFCVPPSFSQKQFCARIDSYNALSKTEARHFAIVELNNTRLEKIIWVNNDTIEQEYFGTTIFYGETATFTTQGNNQYRITIIKGADDCFKDLKIHNCNAILSDSKHCSRKTTSDLGLCWRH